ncbi:hypothetical protein ACP275_09G050400 [Erythranthe tilingii]
MWYMMGSTVSLVGCAMFFILMFQPQMQISVEEEANYVYVAHPAAALMRTLEEEANYVIAPPAPLMIFHDKQAEITAFPRINRSTTTVQELYYAFFKGCELMDSEMPEEATDGDAYEDSYYVDRNVVEEYEDPDGGQDDDDDDEENPNYDYAGDDSSDDDDDDDDDHNSDDDDSSNDDDDDSSSSSDDEEDDDEAAREEWEAFRNQHL